MMVCKITDNMKISFSTLCMLIVLNVFMGIAYAQAENQAGAGIRIVSSIKPLALLIQEISDDNDEVIVLLESQQDYDSTQLKPSQLQTIAQAEVIFYIDDGFEKFVTSAKKDDIAQFKYIQMSETPNLRLLGLRQSGELPQVAHNSLRFSQAYLSKNRNNIDWHIWLNPDNAIVMLRKIRDELSKIRPEKQHIYQERYEIFSRHLIHYSSEKAEMMMTVLDSPFFVLQDGLQYFEEQFGLQSKGIILQHGQKTPSTKHISKLQKLRNNYDVNIVIKEEQFSEQVITDIAGNKQFKVISVDSLAQGSFSQYEDYISYTDAITERIFSGLRK